MSNSSTIDSISPISIIQDSKSSTSTTTKIDSLSKSTEQRTELKIPLRINLTNQPINPQPTKPLAHPFEQLPNVPGFEDFIDLGADISPSTSTSLSAPASANLESNQQQQHPSNPMGLSSSPATSYLESLRLKFQQQNKQPQQPPRASEPITHPSIISQLNGRTQQLSSSSDSISTVSQFSQSSPVLHSVATFSPTKLEDKTSDIPVFRSFQSDPDGLKVEELREMDRVMKKDLERYPKRAHAIISNHMNVILRSKRHVIGKMIFEFIADFKASKIIDLNCFEEINLNLASKLIGEFIEKCILFTVVRYMEMDRYRDCLLDVISNVLFASLFEVIFRLYIRTFMIDDGIISSKMHLYSRVGPERFHASKETCEIFELMKKECEGTKKVPFQKAIDRFRNLTSFNSPKEKAQCLVETGEAINDFFNQFCFNHNRSEISSLSADDLLPLMTYVIVQSRIPFLHSECKFICDFLPQRFNIGPAAYFLCTFDSSLAFLKCDDEE